ncbi:MAG: hypothetical protein Q7Q73_17820 [Verrucomicrobiota bacterium JB024]|nr:hypothetical protein [Verrucomicrobiota bacterium JB024]
MKRLVYRLWHSPTFTAWANRATQSVRLIVLLPLILKRFDDTQVASWFLFSSILFFGQMLSRQTALVMARMTAMANGGLDDLSPHTGKARATTGQPNWPLIERLYGTLQSLNAILASVGLLLAAIMGYYSLQPMLSHYDGARDIWWAFAILMAGYFLNEFFRKYEVTLKGLNQVALTNRWNALFSILSSCSGALVLLAGGSIIELAFAMQIFILIGLLRQWGLLMFLVEPRFRAFKTWSWHKDIIRWAWQPLWRGMIQALANRGGSKISAVVLARHCDPVSLASILLAIRVLETLEDVSSTPITSHSPRFGRLLGEGKIDKFRQGMERAFRLSSIVHVSGVVLIGFFAGLGLRLLGSDTQFIPMDLFFSLGIAQTLFSTVRKSLMISIVGNNVVAVERYLAAAAATALLAFWLIPMDPFWGFLVSSYFPVFVLVNYKPLQIGCRLLQESMSEFLARTMLIPAGFLLVSALFALSLCGLHF